MQRLSCPLLRDNTAASPDELAAVREQFLRQFVVRDLDSDRHPDLAGIREFGANWARYCVWLYDPKQHFFAKDFLAEQMELMTNLEPLAGGQGIAFLVFYLSFAVPGFLVCRRLTRKYIREDAGNTGRVLFR